MSNFCWIPCAFPSSLQLDTSAPITFAVALALLDDELELLLEPPPILTHTPFSNVVPFPHFIGGHFCLVGSHGGGGGHSGRSGFKTHGS
jgi:hypothetical protein